MATQVNLKNLQDSLARTKQYIDDKGGAMVYRMETVLTPMQKAVRASDTTTAVLENGAWTLWGQRGGSPLILRQDVTTFDAIEITVSCFDASTANYSSFQTFTIPMDRLIYQNQHPLYWIEESPNAQNSIKFAIGLNNNQELGFTWVTHTGSDLIWSFGLVRGINYVPMENYSTTEQVVGTWIDGSPLYQKTVPIQLSNDIPASNPTTITIDTISNLSLLIDAGGYINWSDGANSGQVIIGYGNVEGSSNNTNMCRLLSSTNGTIRLNIAGTHFRSQTGHATLKYTKTGGA